MQSLFLWQVKAPCSLTASLLIPCCFTAPAVGVYGVGTVSVHVTVPNCLPTPPLAFQVTFRTRVLHVYGSTHAHSAPQVVSLDSLAIEDPGAIVPSPLWREGSIEPCCETPNPSSKELSGQGRQNPTTTKSMAC